MYDDPKSKIGQLEKVLDAREDHVSGKAKRHNLHNKDVNIRQDWDKSEFEEPEPAPILVEPSRGRSLSVKILIGSIIFFVLALIVVLFNFFIGNNLVSGNNIEITIKAPISVAGGETVPFELEIKNNNKVSLLGADLGVTFPTGARDPQDTSQPAKRTQIFIGDISSGQSVKKNMSVVLFGEENEKKDIDITLEYKVAGSNSLFNKTKKVSILVTSAPVNIVVTGPQEVNTNQSVDFTVDITSNSPTVIKGLLLKAEYPFGFVFSKATPKTFSKDNLWLIGDLEPGAKRSIKISGVLSGQEGEERGFNFIIGSQSKADSQLIDVPFTSSFSAITIRRPFVSADILFNGLDTPEYIAQAGGKVETTIRWQNNLPYEVSDVSIIIKLSGNAIDKSSVQADKGFYQSINNTIIFDKTTDKTLAQLDSGQTGTSRFTFGSFSPSTITGATLSNVTINLAVSVKGKRVDYAGGSEDVLFSDSRKVKLTSNPQLFAKALYYVGPFQNRGLIPPKAEQETTYTVTWTVTNPLNNLSGVQVSAVLPPYIKWLSAVSPDREKVDYDSGTGTVVWNVGNISAGAGIISPAKEVSFQVSFLPSVSQIGTTPNLVSEASLSARDNFTLTDVADSFSALNTRLSNDPYFRVEADKVVQ